MIKLLNVKKYCCEDPALIENYAEAVSDGENTWHCHHRAEVLPCGVFSIADLKRSGLYWNRPAAELVFMKSEDHDSLHKSNPSESTREKLRKAKGGEANPCFGRTGSRHPMFGKKLEEGHRRALLGSVYGSFWITDGSRSRRVQGLGEIPEGWRRGRAKRK